MAVRSWSLHTRRSFLNSLRSSTRVTFACCWVAFEHRSPSVPGDRRRFRSDGSQVLVSPHTQVVLKQPSLFDPSYLRLLLGRIRAQISKRTGGSPSFQIGWQSGLGLSTHAGRS